jgi:hypothetical protein
MTTHPRFMRKPSPTSIGGFGSAPGPNTGRVAQLKFGTATVFPRFTTSTSSRPLARARSTGSSTETSALNSTRPSWFRGASSTSVIRAFASCVGSIAKWSRPFSSSYGPTSPNARPSPSGR